MKLLDKHASLFTDESKRYGIACYEGWHPILDRLFAVMAADKPPVKILQVKEKFGGLRVYYEGGSEESLKALRNAEEEADRTCEFCGKAGVLQTGGWMRVLCDTHAKERNAHE